MLIKGNNADYIKDGNTLSDDQFAGSTFDYILSNPPFGREWKNEKAKVEEEAKLGFGGRFGAGLPATSDGQMLFLMTAISKMKDIDKGGSRIAIIHNGSPLFTGDAGSGPSEIRRYILENDLLEAIIALPNDIFYNTGIATYIWVLSNKKAGTVREGKVQLINANEMYVKRRKALGNKRNDISKEDIAEITKIYGDFKESEISQIYDNEDFGYTKITVERPLRDEEGNLVLKKGKKQPDTSLRDTENVPLKEDIKEYFEREVLPFAPDAWIDEKKSKVGYEIPFTRYFYKYEAPQRFTKEVLLHMRERLSDYQEKYEGELFNLEATPAESTAYRLAKHDRKRWPDIKTAGKEGDTPYYTNSSHLPVEYTTDIFDALDIQDDLQTLYTSGTVFHAFIGEKLPDWKAAAALVRKIAENYKLPYYTISPTYSVCKEHGYISGEHFTCPKCGKKAEVYSRITGYYRPVQNWNDGKAQEYKNRTLYDVMHSDIRKIQPVHASVVTVTKDDVKIEPVASHKYLFTTSTCPNCRVAKKILEGREFEIIDAEKNPEMVKEFGIMQAPTLVITDGEHMTKYVNTSNIKKYVDEGL